MVRAIHEIGIRAMEMEEPPPCEKVAYLYNVLQTML